MRISAILFLILTINLINVSAQNSGLDQGKKLFLEDEHAEAIKAFDNCVKRETSNKIISECLQLRAVSHAKNGNNLQADRDISAALKLTPNNPNVYFNRGRISYSREELNKALSDFNRAVGLGIKDAEAFYLRGIIYSESNDLQKSINDFSTTLKLNPNKIYAYSLRGDLYLTLKKYDAAINDLTKFIELTDDKLDGYLTRGKIYQISGNKIKAKADYEKALEEEPASEAAKNSLKQLNLTVTEVEMWVDELLRNENGYFAIEFLNKYPEFANESHLVLLQAQSYLNVGETKEADKIYFKLFSDSISSGDKNFTLAEIDFTQNRLESSMDLYKKALEDYENAFETNRIRDNVYKLYKINNKYKNPKQIPSTAQATGKFQKTANRIGKILMRDGKLDLALSFYNRSLNIDQNNINALQGRAKVYRQQNKLDLAIADEQKLKMLFKKN